MECTKLKIANTGNNYDCVGTYKKADVEKEMHEIMGEGYEIHPTDWLEWVFGHMIDFDLPTNAFETLVNPLVVKMVVDAPFGQVFIEKA